MFRKQKVQLFIIIYAISAFAVPITISILFPKQLLHFTKISYLFFLLCVIALFLPIGNRQIGENNAKPQQSFGRWLLTIIVLEIGLSALFFMQHNVAVKTLFLNAVLQPPFLHPNLGLFPWTLFAIVAINFAYFSHKRSLSSPFSALIPLWPTAFSGQMAKRVIDVYIKKATTLFIAANISFIALQLCYVFMPNTIKITLLNGLIISGVLLVLYQNNFTQNLLTKLEKRHVFQNTQFLFMIIIFIIIILTINGLISSRLKGLHYVFEMPAFLAPLLKTHPKTTFRLWNWIWWILAAPSFCSLLTKISYGRKIRTFILVVLALPLAFTILAHVIKNNWLSQLVMHHSAWLNYSSLLLGSGFLSYFLFYKNNQDYLWLGFIPVQPLKKSRQPIMRSYWLPAICMAGLLCIGGFKGVQLLTLVFALPSFLVFILFSCLGFFINFS